MMATIQKANLDDIPFLTRTLLNSFDNDPLFRYFIDDDSNPSDMKEDSIKIHSRRLNHNLINGSLFKISTNIEGSEEDIYSGFIMMYTYPQKYSPARSMKNFISYISEKINPSTNQGLNTKRLMSFDKLHNIYFERAFEEFSGNFVYLEVVAVSPSKQGLGLGKKLMEFIVKYSAGRPIFLECTDPKNEIFYKKYGFVSIGQTTLDDEKTEINFMVKRGA